MKIPGCRTPGHQENLNFSAINVNTGPGDVEWYCVHGEYWGVMSEIIRKQGLVPVRDSWWPQNGRVQIEETNPMLELQGDFAKMSQK